MDERDYKAMNEELNQPSCLGAVISRLVELAKEEYGEFKEEFVGYVIGYNIVTEYDWDYDKGVFQLNELINAEKDISEDDIKGIENMSGEQYIYECEDNFILVKKHFVTINKGWKVELLHLINGL